MDHETIPGIRKAAVLLMTLDEELSKELIKELDQEDIDALAREISRIRTIPEEQVTKVHEEFMQKLEKKKVQIVDCQDKFKKLIKKSLGDDRAEEYIGNMESGSGRPGEFLRTCDPKLLANILRNEHPQTIALALSILGAKKAGESIRALPDRIQSEVIIRMANLEKVDKKILEEIETVLKVQLETVGMVEGEKLGGVDTVANILNQMDRAFEDDILGRIEEANPDLAERIRQLMFTFDDLLKLDDQGIQVLLKEVSNDDIRVALKGAAELIKDKIFRNMSERASMMLKEDIEAMGPVRVSDVEKAQISVAMVAKKLDAEGKLVLSRGEDRFI
jgi:flagellar motor switch protein FliG